MDRDRIEIEFHPDTFVVFLDIIDDDEFAALSFRYVAVEGECGIDGSAEGGRAGVVLRDGAFQGNGGGGRDSGGRRKRIDTIG